jgi:hypothetical protein
MFYFVLRLVCLLICISRMEEPPILEEEPHIPDDPIDTIGDISEDECKSHQTY